MILTLNGFQSLKGREGMKHYPQTIDMTTLNVTVDFYFIITREKRA
jgi:hypothetical protein